MSAELLRKRGGSAAGDESVRRRWNGKAEMGKERAWSLVNFHCNGWVFARDRSETAILERWRTQNATHEK
jgi:hypothetical protein